MPHLKSGSVIVFINRHVLLVDEIIATNEKQPFKLKSLEHLMKHRPRSAILTAAVAEKVVIFYRFF